MVGSPGKDNQDSVLIPCEFSRKSCNTCYKQNNTLMLYQQYNSSEQMRVAANQFLEEIRPLDVLALEPFLLHSDPHRRTHLSLLR